MTSAGGFNQDELLSISERALEMAKGVADPGMRISLQLLGEAAANVAAKLPAKEPSRAEVAEPA